MPTSTPIKPNSKYFKNCERAMSHQAKLGYGQNKHGDNKLNYSPPSEHDKNKSITKSSGSRKSTARRSSRRTPRSSNINNGSDDSNSRSSDIRKSTKRSSSSRKSASPANNARSSGDEAHIETGYEESLAFQQVLNERKELKEQVKKLKACLETSIQQTVDLTEEKDELHEKLWTHKCLRSQMKKRAVENPCKFIDGRWLIEGGSIRIEIGAKKASGDRDEDSEDKTEESSGW